MDPPAERSLYGVPMPSPKEVASWDTGVKERGTNYLEEDLTLTDLEKSLFSCIRSLGTHQQQALMTIVSGLRAEGGIAEPAKKRQR